MSDSAADAHRRLPAIALADGEMTTVDVGGEPLVICRLAERYHAIRDRCTHANQKLSEGRMRGHTIYCPLHGARFDLRNGRCLTGPATEDVPAYDVHEDAQGLFLGRRIGLSQ